MIADSPLHTVVDAALRGTLLALLLLLAALLWRDRPRLAAARAGVLMCLGMCVQVVGSTPLLEAMLPRAWQWPIMGISVGNSVVFWIFVQALFDDEFRFRPLHGVAWLAVAGLGAFNCAFMIGSTSALAGVTWNLMRAAPLLFAGLAAVAAATHWRDDLVEIRRRIRVFIVVTGVLYTVGMLVARLAAPHGRLSEGTATLDVVIMLAMVAVSTWRLVRLGTSDLFPSSVALRAQTQGAGGAPAAAGAAAFAPVDSDVDDAPASRPLPPPDAAEQRLADALERLMRDERVYRSEELTVASLAARLAVPEYRLRRLINQRLGHRNFNAFVNGYRLDEARAALANPAQRELPVLSIALEAGFQSIGPFNRAFKAATGLTPTEFRREKLADS